jgi:hypothetical protein
VRVKDATPLIGDSKLKQKLLEEFTLTLSRCSHNIEVRVKVVKVQMDLRVTKEAMGS